ncbi:hypothetical protein ElyMa_001326100 [Elysia marginata]|uniref:PRELI/MSF1 domain-containing protein n=1 Tax=Elysia marginata TaxID=1093978 RepID=A0AAV4IJG8_9GAST|nr:hypothetical protein ElyMa_001326100 [Elysia marginata]
MTPLPLVRGVPHLPAAIEDVFKKSELTHGINTDGETLTLPDLRFVHGVTLLTKTSYQMDKQTNTPNVISKVVGIKIHERQTIYTTNYLNKHERSRGRQKQRWSDDLVQLKVVTWRKDARDKEECTADVDNYLHHQWKNTALE